MRPKPAPELRPIAPLHNPLVGIDPGLFEEINADIANLVKLTPGRIKHTKRLIEQLMLLITEHVGERRITAFDHPVFSQHNANRCFVKGQLCQTIEGTHHILPSSPPVNIRY
jgi:hypothetical protein